MTNPNPLLDPSDAIEILGIRLVGLSLDNGKRLLLTLLFIGAAWLLYRSAMALADWLQRSGRHERLLFWLRQGARLATGTFLFLTVVSIWFDNPTSLATVLGLITAGLAFAMQKAVTAIAGYFIILRGHTLKVGDRIIFGGVRGDVVALSFFHTTLMEMGAPPSMQGGDSASWVQSRQYTGRMVTVSNDKIFDEPVYNYTRDFPYLWEEIALPITYHADRSAAESILLDVAERHTVAINEVSEESFQEMQRRYGFIKSEDIRPKVYYRLTDNWLELTVRFITKDYGIRGLKDAMSREILQALDEAGIGIASATLEIVGLPPLQVRGERT